MSAADKLPPVRWPARTEALESTLFSAAKVGSFTSRTRTWVPAMVPWRADPDGFVSKEVLDWYGRFAHGRPGVLVVEATGIRDVASGPLLRIGDDRFIPGLRELVAVVKERSAGQTRLVVQIIDFLSIRRRPTRENFLGRFLVVTDAHRAALNMPVESVDEVRAALLALPIDELGRVLAPRELEDMERGYRERVTDTQLPHIASLPRVLPQLFADAARRARDAGFDGVELHYAHAYTMASFLSKRNTRTDGYGGSREERARLPLEVLRAVRDRVGADFTVGCRLLGDEVIEGGSRIDDACFFSAALARAGIDYVSVSKGGKFEDAKQPKVGEAIYPYTGPSGHECMPTLKHAPEGLFGRNLHLSRAIRDAVRAAGCSTPIVGSGAINSFDTAENALKNGDCDLVAAARQSLADPDWWRKMEEGRGSEVRRCIYTNYCEALDQRHNQVTCQLWDRDFAREDESGGIARSHDGKRRLIPPP